MRASFPTARGKETSEKIYFTCQSFLHVKSIYTSYCEMIWISEPARDDSEPARDVSELAQDGQRTCPGWIANLPRMDSELARDGQRTYPEG
jgi:hypothetical protein